MPTLPQKRAISPLSLLLFPHFELDEVLLPDMPRSLAGDRRESLRALFRVVSARRGLDVALDDRLGDAGVVRLVGGCHRGDLGGLADREELGLDVSGTGFGLWRDGVEVGVELAVKFAVETSVFGDLELVLVGLFKDQVRFPNLNLLLLLHGVFALAILHR